MSNSSVKETWSKRYWAGGFGKEIDSQNRLKEFIEKNYWQALDYEDVEKDPIAIKAWSLFNQIRVGDWFLIKGFGGSYDLNVHYVGEVIRINKELGRLDFKKLDNIHYSGKAPRGEGAGVWFDTLLEIYRPEDIQMLFYPGELLKEDSDTKKEASQTQEKTNKINDPLSTSPTDIKAEINLSDKLKNSGYKIRNDVVFKGGPYDIVDHSYVFTIFPKTLFWRFGLRFSKTTDIEIDLNSNNRHQNPLFHDVHVSVGGIGTGKWAESEKLELNQYFFPGKEHVLNRCTDYKPESPVQFRVTYSQENKQMEVSISSSKCEQFTTTLLLDEWRYFKIFAWADNIEYELDFITEMIPFGDPKITITEPKYMPPDNFTITEDEEGVIGVNDLAGTMANLIKNLKQTDKGKMVGIFGPWGRGKTFLMDKMWLLFKNDKTQPFIRVNFHAWKYQDTPASWAYLYEAFAEEYFRTNEKYLICKEWEKFCKKMELNWYRVGWKPLVLLTLSIIGSVVFFIFSEKLSELKNFLLFFGIVSVTTVQFYHVIKKSVSEKAKELFDKYYSKVSFSNLLGTQAEIQNELRLLLKRWIKENVDTGKVKNNVAKNKEERTIERRILLFVDDIDRCKEERIMEIIDALRVMLEDDEISKRVVVVAAIDERVLKRAIKWKYYDMLDKDCDVEKGDDSLKQLSKNITIEYMDKLFLSGISLGILSEFERVKILGKYIQGRTAPRKVVQQKEQTSQSLDKEKSVEEKQNSKINENASKININKKKELEDIATIDDKQYDLSKDEEEYLIHLMAFCSHFTPRQIRIFYYRYLLARNFLRKRYEQNGNFLNKTKLEVLGRLLMHYSILKDIDQLKFNKMSLYNKEGDLASMTVLNSNEGFNRIELIEYHEIMEIVVAY